MCGNHTERSYGHLKTRGFKATDLSLNDSKVVNCTAFCLATEKSQMMVQLTAAREFCNNLSIPLLSDFSPAILLWLKLYELHSNNSIIISTLGVGEQGHVTCFSLLVVLITQEEIEKPECDLRMPPFTAAVVKDDEAWEALGTITAMTIWYHARSLKASSQPASAW